MSDQRSTPADVRARLVDEVAQQLLSRAALLLRLLARQVRSGEITRTELDVLSILGERSLRITELAERAGLAQPTMTLLVRRLEQRGWVARERLPADGRVAMIVITSAGQAAWESFRARALRAMRDDLRELSDEQLRELAAAAATLSWFVGDLQRSSSGSPPEA